MCCSAFVCSLALLDGFAEEKLSSDGDGPKKRKRKVLTIMEKIKICELTASKMLYAAILEKLGIGWSTLADICKQEQDLCNFQRKAVEMNLPEAKSMKTDLKTLTKRCICGSSKSARSTSTSVAIYLLSILIRCEYTHSHGSWHICMYIFSRIWLIWIIQTIQIIRTASKTSPPKSVQITGVGL